MIRLVALRALAACALLLCAPAQAATEIQRVVSPGGLVAWLVEDDTIPMIALEAVFDGGASLDPDEAHGAAFLAAGLFEEGAGDLDAESFQRAREDLAARMGFDVGRDSFSVSLRTLTENADASFALLALALTEPRFDEAEVERVRAQVLSIIRQDAVSPDSLASAAFSAVMFPDDPYGRTLQGSLESVAALTIPDLRAAADRITDRGRLTIGIVGDIDAERLGPLLDKTFGALPEGTAPVLPMAGLSGARGLRIVDIDVPQSTAIFGHEGILRDDDDYIIAYVMNQIFGGGGFSSRLTEEVRAERGLAYGVYSYLSPRDRAGLYLGSVATQNGRMAETIQVIRDEWTRLAEEGVTAEELAATKTYLTGAFALRFDSNAKIANFLVGAQRSDLGIDYIERRNSLIEAVTLEDIKRVARRLLRPEDMLVVVAGAPEGVEESDGW